MIPTQWKAAIIVAVIVVLAAMGFMLKYQHDMIQRQQFMEQSVVQMKQLQDNIARAQGEYVSKKDLDTFAKQNAIDLGPIREDLKKLGATIDGIAVVVAKTPGENVTNIQSTTVVPNKQPIPDEKVKCSDGSTVTCPDTFGYLHNTQELKLDEPVTNAKPIPWGMVSFSASREKPWDLVVLPREYSATTVLSVNADGRHFVHNQLSIKSDGKTYTIPIDHNEFAEVYPSESFSFSPRLYLGADFGLYANPPISFAAVPNLQLAIFSYGKTKLLPVWTFLGVGLGYEAEHKGINLVISPANFNIGQYIPFTSNLFVGPTVGIDAGGNILVLGGIRVGL
jgi:hypothetical protein